MSKLLRSVEQIWSVLDQGVFCAYKPPGVELTYFLRTIRNRLVLDLNELLVDAPLRAVEMPKMYRNPESNELYVIDRVKQADYSRHPRVVGQRFQPEDLKLEACHSTSGLASGVTLVGINSGCDALPLIRQRRFVSAYELGAQLGSEKMLDVVGGKTIRQADFAHVNPSMITRYLARITANFQRNAIEFAGFPRNSQEAFDLLAQGPPRPTETSPPLYYELKFCGMKRGAVFLRAAVINEDDRHLASFVSMLGKALNSLAYCTKIHKIAHGPFDSEHALTVKHCSLQHILHNIQWCRQFVQPKVLRQVPRVLSEQEIQCVQLLTHPVSYEPDTIYEDSVLDCYDETPSLSPEHKLIQDQAILDAQTYVHY